MRKILVPVLMMSFISACMTPTTDESVKEEEMVMDTPVSLIQESDSVLPDTLVVDSL